MAGKGVSRRLAAILAADVAGYTRLVEEDTASTVVAWQAARDDIIDPGIAKHAGRVVKLTGDGFLAEFPTVQDAVECAVELQDGLKPSPLEFRMGVSMGDIVDDGQDVHGEGVNIAARLEGLADPGGICISGSVYEQVRNRIEADYEDCGKHEVKNVSAPIEVYSIGGNRDGKAKSVEALVGDKPSIAVLPFDNLSGDPEQDYFSDGLSEDIITLLSAWRSFPVVARNSSFAFRGQSRDVRQIANALSAHYVLEGSVRKSGNRVRVTAQLIDAQTGNHLWAQKFDGVLDDIFEIQDEMSQKIVAAVEPEMEQAELNHSTGKRSSNLNAWDFYLRGMALLHKFSPEGNMQARAMFEQAIELDDNYGDAFAALTFTFLRDIQYEIAEDREAYELKALEAARRAVVLDDGSSFAHLALGSAYIYLDQHQLSIAETRTALRLNPSNAQARMALGNRLDIVGESEEGIPLLEKALELNPRDPHIHFYYAQLARAKINARDYDAALDCLRESLRRNPNHPNTYHLLVICLGHLGRRKEAQEAADHCENLHPGFLKKRFNWNIYLDPAANQHLMDGLKKAGVEEN